jgi:hypothetical protein
LPERQIGGDASKKQASASFLKKRSKKLLLTAGVGPAGAQAPRSKSFFASFFLKKRSACFP